MSRQMEKLYSVNHSLSGQRLGGDTPSAEQQRLDADFVAAANGGNSNGLAQFSSIRPRKTGKGPGL